MKNKLFIIVFFFGGSCGDNSRLAYYQDPFLDSFRGRGIKYMLSFDSEDTLNVDTVTFDSIGGISRLRAYGLKERRAYDSLNFIRRKLQINDIPVNYLFKYHFDRKGYLIQEWIKIPHLNWSYSNNEIDTIVRTVKYKLDAGGKVIEEIDSLGNELSLFFIMYRIF
jgi:hypothetical protein